MVVFSNELAGCAQLMGTSTTRLLHSAVQARYVRPGNGLHSSESLVGWIRPLGARPAGHFACSTSRGPSELALVSKIVVWVEAGAKRPMAQPNVLCRTVHLGVLYTGDLTFDCLLGSNWVFAR